MSHHTGRVARSADRSNPNAIVPQFSVRITGIEFINDYPMEANGNNLPSDTPEAHLYTDIPANFNGWGRGFYLEGWDWEAVDDPKHPVCYKQGNPLFMNVRLRASLPPAEEVTFVLHVAPTVDGDAGLLTPWFKVVTWLPADQMEKIVETQTAGALPMEVSRYHVTLTWSITGLASGNGRIATTNHTVFSIYHDPLDPDDSSATGKVQSPVTGLTEKRLDKLTLIVGGPRQRCPTRNKEGQEEVHPLVWKLCKTINDSGPPHFYGGRGKHIEYGVSGHTVEVVDQWLMWLEGSKVQPDASAVKVDPRTGRPVRDPRTGMPVPLKMSWTVGACISYVQLMKTMLAAAGINSQRAWVIPKTTLLPGGVTVSLSNDELIAFDHLSLEDLAVKEQSHTFWVINQPDGRPVVTDSATASAVAYKAAVRLIDKPGFEYFEACLYYKGKLVPGAIATWKYPADVLSGRVGFPDALAVLRWWYSVPHGAFHRFMAWVSESPEGYFDRDSKFYDSPYAIHHNKWLPVP